MSLENFVQVMPDGTVKTVLTKREIFAALAMNGILSGRSGVRSEDSCAMISVGMADALIKELNEPTKRAEK